MVRMTKRRSEWPGRNIPIQRREREREDEEEDEDEDVVEEGRGGEPSRFCRRRRASGSPVRFVSFHPQRRLRSISNSRKTRKQ